MPVAVHQNVRDTGRWLAGLETPGHFGPVAAMVILFRLFQNGEQFVVDLFGRYVVQRDRFRFFELHPVAGQNQLTCYRRFVSICLFRDDGPKGYWTKVQCSYKRVRWNDPERLLPRCSTFQELGCRLLHCWRLRLGAARRMPNAGDYGTGNRSRRIRFVSSARHSGHAGVSRRLAPVLLYILALLYVLTKGASPHAAGGLRLVAALLRRLSSTACCSMNTFMVIMARFLVREEHKL